MTRLVLIVLLCAASAFGQGSPAFNLLIQTPGRAARDTLTYGKLLISQGGTDIVANGEAAKLRVFAEQLYAIAGRQDFLTLRSAQNMGTGAVAYTLHGNAVTLVNGPTWGANGVVFTRTSSQYATWPIPGAKTFTALSVFARGSTSDAGNFPWYWSYSKKQSAVGNEWYLDTVQFDNNTGNRLNAAGGGALDITVPATTAFGFQSVAVEAAVGIEGSTNGAYTAGTAGTFAFDMVEIILGARWDGYYNQHSDGTHAFFGHVNGSKLSSANVEALRALYKSTIGSGLGLP